MENWLARSPMNVQRPCNVEKKESGHGNGPVPHRNNRSYLQSFRGRTRGGHLTRERRERQVLPPEDLGVSYSGTPTRSPNCGSTMKDFVQQPCCDGYLNSAKLLVYPGSQSPVPEDDRLSNWDSLALAVQLIVEDIACPICLYPPVFPRMERCGHVYCGPCVLQYIKHENNSSTKKCAVCSWIIRLEDLKRVQLVSVSPITVGSTLDLSLLKRSTLKPNYHSIVPVNPTKPGSRDFENYQFIQETTIEQVTRGISEEVHALMAYKTACVEEGNVEIVPYISSLITIVETELTNSVWSNHSPPTNACGSDVTSEVLEATDYPDENQLAAEDCVYFYQACDGQLIFLDGLMWKCLLTEYDGVSNLPALLSVTVSDVKTYKMNHILRKRWKYLSHVPLGRTFCMIEIQLEPHVSEATLNRFSSPLTVRLTERTRRQMEDMRLTQLKLAAENRIPTLPEGFKLSGHAELSDQRLPPDPSDFVPLCSTMPIQPKSTASFAEVTKMGARSLVDRNRIANFSRGLKHNPQSRRFDPSTEFWPSLGEPSKEDTNKCKSTGDHTITWRPPAKMELVHVSGDTATEDITVLSSNSSVIKQSSKKGRKRRSRILEST